MDNIFNYIEEDEIMNIWEQIYCEYNLNLTNTNLNKQSLFEELVYGLRNEGFTDDEIMEMVK